MYRNRKYLDWLRTQRCLITGRYADESEAVDPCHIGTAGRGVKSPDNECLPLIHWVHQEMHQRGEIKVLRELAPDWLIREMARAYAREIHKGWDDGEG